MLVPWKKSYDQARQLIKKQRHYFVNKGPSGQGYHFSSSHECMWELDYKERWVPNNWCFWTVVLKKTLESPLNSKKIQPVQAKGNQFWIFIGRTDAENWNSNTLATWWEVLTYLKRPWCLEGLKAWEGYDRGWDGWIASLTQRTGIWINSGSWWWTRSLACCTPWGCKELDTTEWLNWTECNYLYLS